MFWIECRLNFESLNLYHLRRDSELDSEGVYLVTESRDRKSLQIPYTGMPEKMGH